MRKVLGLLLLAYPITMMVLYIHTAWEPVRGYAALAFGYISLVAGLVLVSPLPFEDCSTARSRGKEVEELTESRDIALQDLADEAKEVDQLKRDLEFVMKEAGYEIHPDYVKEIRKRHGLEEV